MVTSRKTRWFLAGIVTLAWFGMQQAWAQGGVAAGEPQFKVVRSVSGPKGEVQNGRFVMQDPRDVFYLPADKHVVVYFEWEGPIGTHHLEGFWKNPQGKSAVMSDFTYEAKQKRFGAYWSLDVSENMAPGTWMLEARVDGEVTGNHSFQVIAADRPASAPVRPLLDPAEIYKRAVRATVSIEKLDSKEERMGAGSGFFLDDGLLVTAFQVIDAASTLRIILPNAQRVETVEVAGWNRLQDWALLKAPIAPPASLPRAKDGSWSVGDRCFSLDVPAAGNRVIVDANITGTHDFARLGPRLNLSQAPAGAAIGSPVLNEYGEVIGVLGGSVWPGAPSRTERVAYSTASPLMSTASMATPVSVLPTGAPATPAKSLAELAVMGEFVPRLEKQPELLQAFLTSHFDPKKNEIPGYRESKTEFSGSDRHCTVVLVWNPRVKLKDEVMLAIFDLDNHPVVKSNPLRLKLSAGTFAYAHWDMDFTRLSSGSYRVDVVEGNKPIWRTYFRIVE